MSQESGLVEDLKRQLDDIRDAVDDASQAEEAKRSIKKAALQDVRWPDLQYDINRAIDRLIRTVDLLHTADNALGELGGSLPDPEDDGTHAGRAYGRAVSAVRSALALLEP